MFDFRLLLATFEITASYVEQKPGVLILAAAGNLRPQDLKITFKKDPKTTPRAQRNPKGQIEPKRNLQKDLERPILIR
jgi:hypothetical protein